MGMAAYAGVALVGAGCGVGVTAAWLALVSLALSGSGPRRADVSAVRWNGHPAARLPTRYCRLAAAAACRFGLAFRRRTFHRRGRGLVEVELGDRRDGPQRTVEVGVDQLKAASSTAVTVPPCAPGEKRKCARLSERPAFQPIWTVQRPSSLRHASQAMWSGLRPRATSAEMTVSNSVSTDGTVGEDGMRGGCQLGCP